MGLTSRRTSGQDDLTLAASPRSQAAASGPERDYLRALVRRVRWKLSDRADPAGADIADRHYNRQHPGSPQFVPPGRCFVLLATTGPALWVTSWPFAEYVKHAWAGAWINSCFRNENAGLSSELIREAVAATRWKWPDVPALGMVTFVDASKVRHKRDPGRCYLRAGFSRVGETRGGAARVSTAPERYACRRSSARSDHRHVHGGHGLKPGLSTSRGPSP